MTGKVKKSEQKLVRAFGSVTDVIAESAKKLKTDECDTKKLKELTTVAKELYGIVKDAEEESSENRIDVIFSGDGGQWAK